MKTKNEWRMPKNMAYLLLLAIQLFGTMIFIWQEIPEFEQLLLDPREQLPKNVFSDIVIFNFCMMQISFWRRVLYVPIPFRRPNIFLSHLFYFWDASVLFLVALCSLSSFLGIFLKWVAMPMSCWRPYVELFS